MAQKWADVHELKDCGVPEGRETVACFSVACGGKCPQPLS